MIPKVTGWIILTTIWSLTNFHAIHPVTHALVMGPPHATLVINHLELLGSWLITIKIAMINVLFMEVWSMVQTA